MRKKKVFKSQKEYLRYLRWRRCLTRILGVCIAVLLFVYIVIANPHNVVAWVIFVAVLLLVGILDYCLEQEYLKKDKEAADNKTRQRLADKNKRQIDKHR